MLLRTKKNIEYSKKKLLKLYAIVNNYARQYML